jgi:protein disulfide-isomerase A6
VADLTPEDFDSIVNGRKHALVEFYAPWCGHCKRMTPEFKKLGEKVTGDGKLSSRVVIAKVDADKHRELGGRFDVKGFPTILYFARGKPVESHTPYQGARTYDGFLSFIEDQLENDKGFARSAGLDALATKFLGAAEDARAAVVAEAKTAAAALAGDEKASGDLYERYMQKAITKGSDFFQTEYDRLDRIISSGAASPAKLAEAARKSSVLSAFIPSLNEAAGGEAAVDAEEAEEVGDDAEDAEFEDAEEGFAEGEEVSEEELAEADLLEAEAATE